MLRRFTASRMRRLRHARGEARTCSECDEAPEPGTRTRGDHECMERVKERRRRRLKQPP